MKETDIRKYAALMQELGLTGLEIKDEDRVVRLERTPPSVARETVSVPTPEAPAPKRESAEDSDCTVVRSPSVGVFYAAPAENAEPYVKVGDRVKQGSVLCIIEAMKLMNEICAEQDGTVVEICAQNGQVVEYGTALFKLRR